jgi:hypothetical protein
MNHVAAVIGGVASQQKVSNQDGARFRAALRDRQREAVQFLSAHASRRRCSWSSPRSCVASSRPASRTHQNQPAARVDERADGVAYQRDWWSRKRSTAPAYKPTEFFTDVRARSGARSTREQCGVDPYRAGIAARVSRRDERQDQRAEASASESRPLARQRGAGARHGGTNCADADNRSHDARRTCRDVRDQIARILDPKFAPPTTPGLALPIIIGVDGAEAAGSITRIRRNQESGIRNRS